MKTTILAIDDNKEVLDLENVVLTRAGYEVHTALGGPEALKMIDKFKDIHLILLDYEMDGMNGPEFLAAFEKQFPIKAKEIPVIFVSAHEVLPQAMGKSFIPKLKDLDKFVADVGAFLPGETGYL